MSEKGEISWIDFLREFDEEVWPLFQRRGYTKEFALLAFEINTLKNSVESLKEMLLEGELDDDCPED